MRWAAAACVLALATRQQIYDDPKVVETIPYAAEPRAAVVYALAAGVPP